MSKELDITQSQVVMRRFGRPSKLTPEIVAEAWNYLDSVSSMEVKELPTIEGLALAIGIDRTTIYEWAKDTTSDFSNIVKNLQNAQAQKLMQYSLLGGYNAMIAKLILSGKHGYVEKSEVDNKHEVVTPILGGSAKQIPEETDE